MKNRYKPNSGLLAVKFLERLDKGVLADRTKRQANGNIKTTQATGILSKFQRKETT